MVRSYQAVSMTERLGGVIWWFLSVLSVLRGRNVEIDGNRGVGGSMRGWVVMALLRCFCSCFDYVKAVEGFAGNTRMKREKGLIQCGSHANSMWMQFVRHSGTSTVDR